jgi:hypothetical protein
MHPSPRDQKELYASDRPSEDQREADCLVLLLTDFLDLRLAELRSDVFESWLSVVADCVWALAESEVRHPRERLHTRQWFDLITNHILFHFPSYPGGGRQVQIDLAGLMLCQQRLETPDA